MLWKYLSQVPLDSGDQVLTREYPEVRWSGLPICRYQHHQWVLQRTLQLGSCSGLEQKQQNKCTIMNTSKVLRLGNSRQAKQCQTTNSLTWPTTHTLDNCRGLIFLVGWTSLNFVGDTGAHVPGRCPPIRTKLQICKLLVLVRIRCLPWSGRQPLPRQPSLDCRLCHVS